MPSHRDSRVGTAGGAGSPPGEQDRALLVRNRRAATSWPTGSGWRGKIGHLVDAFARGGDVPSLVAELRTRESRKADLDRRLTQPTVTREALGERLAE